MSKQVSKIVSNSTENSDVKVEIFSGKRGYAASPNVGVLSFEIQGITEREDVRFAEARTMYNRYMSDRLTLNVGGYIVPMWGEGHNLYPQEVFAAVSENKLLPEVINKQVKFMFGKGPRLYMEQISGEGEHQKRVRIPVEDKQIEAWLERWEDNGFPHYWDYLKNIITDFYFVQTCISKYNFNNSRRIGGKLPIAALSYVGADEARLAATNIPLTHRLKNEDCKYVIVGDWMNITGYEYDVYRRFDPTQPLKYSPAIAWAADKTFSKWVYAFNSWFKGLREYLRSSELAPKYLNSYLKNALNAHIHVEIPGEWYEKHREILQLLCTDNLTGGEDVPLQPEYRGVKLISDLGKPIAYSESMMDQLITCELRRITKLMSGEGKNQGKLYATTKWGENGWTFNEFPGKFKEFFDTIIKYDERADKVILANKGISSSITNVDSSGIISKSGNEAWYNYLLYVISLTLDEYLILKELNRAIQINFPQAKAQGIKLGFWIDIPSKLQDTAVSERPAAVATPQNNQ